MLVFSQSSIWTKYIKTIFQKHFASGKNLHNLQIKCVNGVILRIRVFKQIPSL